MTGRRRLLRARSEDGHAKVTFVELFFDLIFVFAVTQLSHALLAHLTPLGIAQTTLLLMAVWWVWIYTSWATNWLDPEQTPTRLLLFALMLAGLVMSISLPKAFESGGLAFAAAVVFMQVGRSAFMVWALAGHDPGRVRNFQRITAWLATAGAFWIAGAFASDDLRLVLWAIALAIEYLAPWAGFWTPGLGRSTTKDWDVAGGHLAERCGLFIIIALGESILVTGQTFARLPLEPATIAAFATAFVGSVAMWWIYFNIGAERGSRHIAASSDPGRLGRLAYTYFHLPLVAGIIVVAASDELILAHPTGHTDLKTAATTLGGAALFLVGNILFKSATAGRLPLSHLVGLALLAALIAAVPSVSPVALGVMTTLVLIVVAVWETVSLQSTRHR
jgi:low temperature requirement protein LtrA